MILPLVLETLQSIQATRIIEQEQVVRLIICHSVIEEGRKEKCDEGSIFAVKDASDDTIPQPKLASDLGSLKITKCRWTARRYKLVTNGWLQYLIFSSDGRTVLLFLYTVNRSVGISFCLGQ